jgi:hypothetical protein
VLPPLLGDILEDRGAGIGRVDQYDASVAGLPAAHDEPTLRQPKDYGGRAGDRDIEGIGQSAHGGRAVGLEDGQDVEMDETQRTPQPMTEGPGSLARSPGGQLLEQILDHAPARCASRRTVGDIIQCHIDNLCDM